MCTDYRGLNIWKHSQGFTDWLLIKALVKLKNAVQLEGKRIHKQLLVTWEISSHISPGSSLGCIGGILSLVYEPSRDAHGICFREAHEIASILRHLLYLLDHFPKANCKTNEVKNKLSIYILVNDIQKLVMGSFVTWPNSGPLACRHLLTSGSAEGKYHLLQGAKQGVQDN